MMPTNRTYLLAHIQSRIIDPRNNARKNRTRGRRSSLQHKLALVEQSNILTQRGNIRDTVANPVIDTVSGLARVETTQHFIIRVGGLSDFKVLRDSRGLVGGDGVDV